MSVTGVYVGVGVAVLIVLIGVIVGIIWLCRCRTTCFDSDDDVPDDPGPELTPVDPSYVPPSTTTSDHVSTDKTETPSTDTVIHWADVFARTKVDETKLWV
jgi:hypothetical protein